MMMRKLFFCLFWSTFSIFKFECIHAGDGLLYKNVSYGQDALFHPINYYLNTAFDTIQNPYYFTQKRIYPNHSLVLKDVSAPRKKIKEYGGFSKFFKDEFVGTRAIPNYSLHLIGEGSDFRRLSEWLLEKEVKGAYVYAFIFSYLAQFGNEALESSNGEKVGATDHIADLLFFDLAGKVLFLNDSFTLFFRDKMQLKTWAHQPLIDPSDGRVYNAGTNYIFRPKIFGIESNLRPIAIFGMQFLLGLSYKFDSGDEFSFAQGLAYTDPLNQKGKWTTGIFYDRNGELLTSLFVNGTENLRLRLNIYPGIIQVAKYPNVKIGVMSGLYRNRDFLLGGMINIPLGIGLVGRP